MSDKPTVTIHEQHFPGLRRAEGSYTSGREVGRALAELRAIYDAPARRRAAHVRDLARSRDPDRSAARVTRAEGERRQLQSAVGENDRRLHVSRLVHSIARMRATLVGLETALKQSGPVGLEAAQAVVMTGTEIALQIAKLRAVD